MKIHNFKKLKVWQKSIDLAVLTYQLSSFFPKEEKYSLTNQVQRSAVSVPSNLAEGCGRVSDKERQHFVSVSMGSSFELETQMILAHRFDYLTDEQLKSFEESVQPVQKMLYGYYNTLEN